MLIKTLLLSFALIVSSGFGDENRAEINRQDYPSCSVSSITTPCRNGGTVTAPGCAVACKKDQRAYCSQGATYTNNCTYSPSRCDCRD